jgi:branched-subunit amino acid transport protein
VSESLWAAILGMFVATYAVCASFSVFGQRLRFPPPVARALVHVPIAVLTAIVVPEANAFDRVMNQTRRKQSVLPLTRGKTEGFWGCLIPPDFLFLRC